MPSARRAARAPDPSVSRRNRADRFFWGFLSLGTGREGRRQIDPRLLIPLNLIQRVPGHQSEPPVTR